MRNTLFFSTFFFIFIASTLCLTTSVQSAGIKERMAGRIPAINTLKAQGAIGENNKGFLEYRTGSKPQPQLVADENKDRAKVYGAISKQQGASAVLVGERRANMIAQKGKAGQWFQKPDGTWYKK
ncbi:MAG: YdbL family protein [Desulfobulbaceae bacterium]|nr:YdbL family protein [Desulfobulbaceae bacterium]